jgi:hypothetical protein
MSAKSRADELYELAVVKHARAYEAAKAIEDAEQRQAALMSGPGKQYDGYRCDDCRRQKNRCDDCRAARAAATRARMERKRKLGVCVQCPAKALKDQALCAKHQALNLVNSKASHARARADG